VTDNGKCSGEKRSAVARGREKVRVTEVMRREGKRDAGGFGDERTGQGVAGFSVSDSNEPGVHERVCVDARSGSE
jgi:hypothetical protein